MAYLAQQGLRPQTISVYLSAIRHLQIEEGAGSLPRSDWPQLKYVLRGIKRANVDSPPRARLPITPEIMQQLRAVCMAAPQEQRFEANLLWAAACLAFFGFLRSGELTSSAGGSPIISLPAGVAVDSHTAPSVLKVTLQRSKTDPFGQGTAVYLGKTNSEVCPVTALLGYLTIRPPPAVGPLFIHSNGSPLTRPQFVKRVKEALSSAGIDQTSYSGHSFRIGAATAAARAGISDHIIKALGRWESEAYQTYIHIPPGTLACSLYNHNP